jgi:hypothetical protein
VDLDGTFQKTQRGDVGLLIKAVIAMARDIATAVVERDPNGMVAKGSICPDADLADDATRFIAGLALPSFETHFWGSAD